MRRSLAFIAVLALVLAWTLPVLAQTSGTTSTTTPAPKPVAPAKPAAPKAKTATGTVKSATADTLVLVGKDKKEMSFGVTKDTKVTKDGKTAEAVKLAENDSATVTYTEAEGKMTAQKVTAKTPKTAAAVKPKA